MNSSRPQPDQTPLRWRIEQDAVESGFIVDCLMPHRHINGFESIAISQWCHENLGAEDVQWGRTVRYGWWIADPARVTHFLMVFQGTKPELPPGTKIRILDQPSSFTFWHRLKPSVDN